jgi:Lrp/AsnC family transcriptional regulator for asnA, asnC and gidA
MGSAAAIVRLEPRAEEAHLKTIQLDDTDIDIIRRLQYDGRLPFTQIAADLSISEGAVRRRVKRLTESGLLQIVAVVEPQFLGWNAAGMIGVTVQSGQVDAVAHRIAQFREVSYLFMVSGEFDLFVEVYCRDMDHFVSFLSQELQQVPGVVHTRTFMILKMYKLSYRWGEAEPQRVNRQPAIGLESP